MAPVALVVALAACGGGEPSRSEVPDYILEARPSITVEEAAYVLAARDLGVDVTGGSVAEDIETGTTVCWALKQGGVEVRDIVSELSEDDALRTKRLMRAALENLCPEFDSQVDQLDLPE